MGESTALERMEKQAELTFGGPKPFGGMVDHVLLEMNDTNKWVHSEEQSNLGIGVQLLHDALVATDNRKPRYKNVKDAHTGEWHAERVLVDNWRWLSRLDYLVKTNQLTIGAFSREQFLKQAIAQSLMAPAQGEPGGIGKWLEETIGK
jgi:hypothetical protein